MNVLDYIEKMKEMYEGERITAQEPRNMYQDGQLVRPTVDGSRPGYGGKKYNWTTIDGVKHPVFMEGPNKGKINWRTTQTVDGKPKTVWTPISKEDLIAQLKKGKLDKIQGAVYSIKDATQLRADLPEGIILSKGAGKKGAYSYRVSWVPRGEGAKARVMLPATEDNIEDLIKRQKVHMKKNYPNILSNEAFENLRMNDENINLTKKQFAEKLNKLGHKTYHNLEFNTKNVSNIETSLNIHKLTNPESVQGRIRSISEAKNIIREKQGGNVWLKEIMNKPKEIRDAEIRIKANRMLGEEYTRKKMGIFAHTNTKEAQMFINWFNANKTGYSDRIQMGGKFDGKDLRHRRNWPKKPNGDVNWQAKGKDGKPAWQSVEFTDTKVPDGKGGFKETKFTWDKTVKNGNIGQQVDNAFGSGFFNKSTKAYDLQKLGSTKNIMFRGKSIPVSQAIAEKMIIDQYKLDNKGRMPTQNQIDTRRKAFSYDEVHHPRGVGNDPYFTENTFRTANRDLNYAEKTYKGKITEAGGNPKLLSQAKKDYIKNIEDISGKYGGIRAEVDGKMIGTKGTHASITAGAGKETGLLKDKGFRNYLNSRLKDTQARSQAKLFQKLGIKINEMCSSLAAGGGRIGFANKVCGMELVESNPDEFLRISGDEKYRKIIQEMDPNKVKSVGRGILKNMRKLGYANPFSWIGGEIWYTGLDAWASKTKGIKLSEALDNAFIFYNFDEGRKNFEKVAEDMGYSDLQMDALRETINLAQTGQEQEKQERVLGNLESTQQEYMQPHPSYRDPDKPILPPGMEAMAVKKTGEQISSQQKVLQDLEEKSTLGWTNLLKNVSKQKGLDPEMFWRDLTEKDLDQTFADIYKTAETVKRKELQSLGEEKYTEKGEQFDPYASPFGSWLYGLFGDKDKEKNYLTWDQLQDQNVPLPKEAMQELYGRGWFGKNIYKDLSYLFEGADGGRAGYTGGGLASLTRTVARDSRPMEQGLRSLYINDKDY